MKNIVEPVQIYRVLMQPEAPATDTSVNGGVAEKTMEGEGRPDEKN